MARGFATTSVPKKVAPAPESVEEPASSARASPEAEADASRGEEGDAGKDAKDAATTTLSEEDQALQGLVERLQDKVEKEIVRTVKVRPALLECEWGMHEQPYIQAIEQERRFSETLLRLELDPRFVDRILELGLEYENSECMYLYGPNRNHVDEICSHQGD